MKATLSIILIFLSAFHIYGQVIIKPLEYNPEQAESHKKNSRFKTLAIGDTITLPFFDDFATTSINPDTSRWIQNGGTYINHNYAIDPPNFNVATFDGLQANGTPYNASYPGPIGLADNLTSLPIDLSILQNGDSIYLRFFWQGDGLGEISNPATDSIRLQIKNRTNVWKTMWKQTADATGFNYELIRIGDSAQYYYKGFQFRFQSFGRLSGSFDTWNIDYIYLDTGRLAKANWTPDLSFTGPPTSFLKNYTAMPIQQYLANKAGETADTVWVQISNLGDRERGFKMDNSESLLMDIKNNLTFEMTSDSTGLLDSALVVTPQSSYFKNTKDIPYVPDISTIPNILVERTLKYKFIFDPTGTLEPKINDYYKFTSVADSVKSNIDFTMNDSISGYTDLTNYYAYDDGSAEFGLGVNQVQAKLVSRFKLNVLPDTLTHIQIYFPKMHVNKTGEPLILGVWKNINVGGSEDVLIYSQSVALNHSTANNKYYTYTLDYPVAITDSEIYIGYQQASANFLYTGFDKNTNSTNNIFFNVNDTWKALTDPDVYEEGSLMIRPVFGDHNVMGYHQQFPTTALDCDVFPNPTQGELFISGRIKNVVLYDLAGRLLLEKDFDPYTETKSIDLSSLSNGFYILHLKDGEAKAVKKIIISR